MTDQADMEARAIEILTGEIAGEDRAWYYFLVRKGDPPPATTEQIVRAMLAYAAEREAAAYDRAAEVARGYATCGCGGKHGPCVADDAPLAIADDILSLKEGKG